MNLNIKSRILMAAVLASTAATSPRLTCAQMDPNPDADPLSGGTAPTPPARAPRGDVDRMLTARFEYRPVFLLALNDAPLPAAADDVAKLVYAVTGGKWQDVGAILSRLSPADATRVHRHILESLNSAPPNAAAAGANENASPDPRIRAVRGALPVSTGDVGTAATSVSQAGAAMTLTTDDVMELAEALPEAAAMDDSQAALLGLMLKKAMINQSLPAGILVTLKSGTRHFGGTSSANRRHAIVLLLTAGKPDLAATFLPSEADMLGSTRPDALQVYALCLMAAADDADAKDAGDVARQQRQTALLLTLKLATLPVPPTVGQKTIAQAFALSAKLGDTRTINGWLKTTLEHHPAALGSVLASLGTMPPAMPGPGSLIARNTALTNQKYVADMLLESLAAGSAGDAPQSDDPRILALNLFAANWMSEAEYTRTHVPAPPPTTPSYAAAMPSMEINEISADQLLPLAPSGKWLKLLSDRSLPRFYRDLLAMNMKAGQVDDGMKCLVELARLLPGSEDEIAGDALQIWGKAHASARVSVTPAAVRAAGLVQGIPLMRITQERNLEQLATMLAQIQKIYGKPVSPMILPDVFAEIYSQADVYKMADIEKIFGPWDQLNPAVGVKLADTMRINLAGVWQSPEAQQALLTGRAPDDMIAEVLNGYDMLSKLLQQTAAQTKDWRVYMMLANVQFSYGEFGLQQKIGLAKYAAIRDGAFDAIHTAAKLYGAQVTAEKSGNESLAVYSLWFSMALGTTDLAQLMPGTDSSVSELDLLREALTALPGAAKERHVAMFAIGLTDQLNSMKPDVKQRILRSALPLMGDSPLARPIASLVRYYDDLLTEVHLRVDLDGSPAVGAGVPFGFVVNLEHTVRLNRESGGLGKYAGAAGTNRSYRPAVGRAAGTYREELEKHIRESMAKGFEVVNIVWPPDDVRPHPIAREGWEQTPLAYVIVKAKDPSVDLLPPIQMDLDFVDRLNQVVLPIASGEMVLNAKTSEARPCSDLSVTQIVNDRDIAQEKLTLEIRASGHGLMPSLEQLLDLSSLSDFKVEKIQDQGLKANSFETNEPMAKNNDSEEPKGPTKPPAVTSEHIWTLTLHANSSLNGHTTFRFPKLQAPYASMPDLSMTYKKYSDVDETDVEPTVMLSGIAVKASQPWWPWPVGGAALLGGIVGVGIVRRRRHPKTEMPIVASPRQFTPFSTLAALRELRMAQGSALSTGDRDRLDSDIRLLQERYFSAHLNGAGESNGADYLEIAREWIQTRRGELI